MRIDVISIFPDYFAPLQLSLVGKAITSGLVDARVHDLRDWTHDRHRTVDDTPYGGGAGMVMKPEPWGEALDAVKADLADVTDRPVLLVPTPSGDLFTQATADALATEPAIVIACGRYEGIDHRVIDWAADHFDVREVSLGDYVLNGGEVAALAMIEAVVRLIPGVVATPSRWSKRVIHQPPTGCSSTPSTRNHPRGAGSMCPRFCSAGTTPTSQPGAARRRRNSPASVAPTCWQTEFLNKTADHTEHRNTPRG